MPAGTVGAIAELVVSTDLMRRGFEVYRALSPSSDCDILAIKNGEIFKIEVRTARYYRANDKSLLYPKAKTNGKSVALVTHVDNKVHYLNEFIV